MGNMNRLLFLFLATAVIICLTACVDDTETNQAMDENNGTTNAQSENDTAEKSNGSDVPHNQANDKIRLANNDVENGTENDAENEVDNDDNSSGAMFDQHALLRQVADNVLTWQMEHGGWSKNNEEMYQREWDGEESRSEWMHDGVELGTLDNGATIPEIRLMADAYDQTGDERYLESALNGIDFLLTMQYPSGGFPQVYPQRGDDETDGVYYSNYVTFNDDAMMNAVHLFDDIVRRSGPFQNTDVINEELYTKIEERLERAVEYILHSQIEVDGTLTAWGQQHDPETYEPRRGRSYEVPSITARESVNIVRYLMLRAERTEEVERAVRSALEWFDKVRHDGVRYNASDPDEQYIIEDAEHSLWYRFYEIGTNRPIFVGRDGIVKYDIRELQEDEYGYAWAGEWPSRLNRDARRAGFID